jgi:isochorismate synthase
VLARTVVATSDHAFDVPTLLERLRTVEHDAYVFGIHGFVGASPELLVARDGTTISSKPLAGTAARAADPDGARLLASAKDHAEHAFVADAVRATLEPHCGTLDVGAPHLLGTSTVWHLATDVRGTVRPDGPTALELAALLHPTPAVCGTPRAQARAAIAELEPFDRGLYTGTVGWVDANGDGQWAVALRCAEVEGARARLFAGAGIVAASDPDEELAETDAKMLGLLDALRYG